jgi:hypothetical protein
MPHPALLLLVALSLAACARQADEPKTASDPHDHVWSTQTRALEKARGVEQTVQDSAARQREAADAQER